MPWRPACGRPNGAICRLILLLGLTGFALYNLALNTGEQSIASGPAAVLIQTAPIWTALLATLMLGEHLSRWGWLGIGISFSGVLVIALGKGQGLALHWGAALILLAAFSTERILHPAETDACALHRRSS